jgi:ABC-type antimicrobial peptide transport system permease subunit
LLKPSDEKSESITFVWEKIEFNFTSGGAEEQDVFALFEAYTLLMKSDWSNLNLTGQDLSGRNISRVDLSGSNLSGANLADVNLSEAILVNADLSYADLSGVDLKNTVLVNINGGSLEGTDFTNANLEGAFGFFDLSGAILTNATCPDGSSADETSCVSGASEIPPPLAADLFLEGTRVQIIITPYTTEMYYMGTHEYVPGVNSATASSALIIGESAWRALVSDEVANNYSSTTWIVDVGSIEGEQLEALGSKLSADSRVSSVDDWASTHKEVERNGGLIFGTPGLLSLQFVVASVAAIASSFVFLSLVLSQRQKELAVLQAIGASPNQIIRLVLFEILSIVMVSMILGIVLGVGLALSFNGFFDVFGFIFQIFGGSSTTIQRTLVYPWFQIILVSAAVFAAVVVALLVTTRRALKADLASVLKGE